MSAQGRAHDGSTGLCTRPGDDTIGLYTLAGDGSTGERAGCSATGASANISANISAGIGADLGTGIDVNIAKGIGADLGAGFGADLGAGFGADLGAGIGADLGVARDRRGHVLSQGLPAMRCVSRRSLTCCEVETKRLDRREEQAVR
jgi:hypothetical protein